MYIKYYVKWVYKHNEFLKTYNLFNEILREHASINIFETNVEKLTTITKDSILNIKERKEGGMLFG